MQITQTYNCIDCGRKTSRKRKFKAPKVCFECGVARMKIAALQVHLREGAAYDRWKNSAGPRGRPRKNAPKE